MSLSQIPNVFVNKYFQMDPETDDLLVDGTQLEDGMVVLTEDYAKRVDISNGIDELSEGLRFSVYENNRWCRVSDVKTIVSTVYFIATYSDGTKRKRYFDINGAWYVKKDSIQKDDEGGNEKGCCVNCWYVISQTCGDEKCVCHDPSRNNR